MTVGVGRVSGHGRRVLAVARGGGVAVGQGGRGRGLAVGDRGFSESCSTVEWAVAATLLLLADQVLGLQVEAFRLKYYYRLYGLYMYKYA